jgi:hypothetical protein
LDAQQRNLAYARIVSGEIGYYIEGRRYTIRGPTIQAQLLAEELYQETLADALASGLFDEQQLFGFLILNGLWLESDVTDQELIEKDIESCKIEIYNNFNKENERELFRNNLKDRLRRRNELLNKRHAYDHLSAMGLALISRHRFLTGCSIYRPDGRPFWQNPLKDYHRKCGHVVETALNTISLAKLGEADYRELARNDPFRSVWICKDHSGAGIFGKAACNMTDEQKSICMWANFYENIGNHPEKPSDEVMDDNDALDGWCILQKNKPKEEKDRLDLGQAGRHEEVFVPLKRDNGEIDKEKADLVSKMNTPLAKFMIAKREALLNAKGVVDHNDMPDIKQKFMNAIAEHQNRGS